MQSVDELRGASKVREMAASECTQGLDPSLPVKVQLWRVWWFE